MCDLGISKLLSLESYRQASNSVLEHLRLFFFSIMFVLSYLSIKMLLRWQTFLYPRKFKVSRIYSCLKTPPQSPKTHTGERINYDVMLSVDYVEQ